MSERAACSVCGAALGRYEVGVCGTCRKPAAEHIGAIVARVMATLQVKKAA